jgi:starch synthase
LLDCPELYNRPGLYFDAAGDYADNPLRFGLLCRAAAEVARHIFRPDIFHCHDWQAGLVPVYLKTLLATDPTFFGIKTLCTIHNLGYQGWFDAGALTALSLPAWLYNVNAMEFYGKINFLKGGLVFSDWLSTVSVRYAQEIQTGEFGFGLDGLLRARASRLSGILNGVDYASWNPATDPLIAANYSDKDLRGKKVCKEALVREFGLPERALTRPLIGIVSRFTSQKGADLIAEAASAMFQEDLYFVGLGSGEARYEQMFRFLADANRGRVAIYFGYNEAMAHRIEAGADVFLMPSQYEPCGLNQIYSLKYGTVPVVRATGGLDDTIDSDTGFKFSEYSGWAMLAAIRECLQAYSEPGRWNRLVRNGMCKDFSWRRSARLYHDLYARILNL